MFLLNVVFQCKVVMLNVSAEPIYIHSPYKSAAGSWSTSNVCLGHPGHSVKVKWKGNGLDLTLKK